jgi:hypothetical protein
MTDDDEVRDAADGDQSDGDQSSAQVPRSSAAAAARRARRIAGPARPANPAKAEPVNTAKRAPVETPVEAVSEPEQIVEQVPFDANTPTLIPSAPPPASTGSATARWLPAAVLVAAAVTMIVLLATFSHSVWWAKPSSATGPPATGTSKGGVTGNGGAVNELRERVLAAAKQCVVATNQYNYKTLDADEAAGAKCTTGVQTSRYKSAMEHLIRKTAIKIKASQVAQINTAGIESVTADGKQWSIVVYGQLAIHNANVKARTDPFAAVARMDYVNGKWLMADLQTLQEPSS